MNFTRDPIIETVITPREGCKLVVRSSKGASQEDYFVDALEVVSFGHSFFFRSIERPKSFLVPVTDYEIFESKEPRLALKNVSADRSIKIGGGKDPAPRNQREYREGEGEEASQDRSALDRNKNGGRDKQRRRGRRGGRDRHDGYSQHEEGEKHAPAQEHTEAPMEEFAVKKPIEEAPKEKAPSFISKLFPPPTTLIKETLGRYKSVDPAEEDLDKGKEARMEEKSFSQDAHVQDPREPFNEEE